MAPISLSVMQLNPLAWKIICDKRKWRRIRPQGLRERLAGGTECPRGWLRSTQNLVTEGRVEAGESQMPGWLYPALPARGVTCRAQAGGGSPGTRWGWVEVSPQQVKGSSDVGQEVSQGSRMDGHPQGMNLDHGQKQVKSGSSWAKQCSQVRPSSTPRLRPKGRGQRSCLKGF